MHNCWTAERVSLQIIRPPSTANATGEKDLHHMQHRFDVFKPERRRFRWNYCSIRCCAAGRATDSIWRPTAQRRDGNQIVVSIYHQIVGLSLHSLYYTAHTTYIRSSTFNQKTLHGTDGVVGQYTTQSYIHIFLPS